jgi:hypothetical protein
MARRRRARHRDVPRRGKSRRCLRRTGGQAARRQRGLHCASGLQSHHRKAWTAFCTGSPSTKARACSIPTSRAYEARGHPRLRPRASHSPSGPRRGRGRPRPGSTRQKTVMTSSKPPVVRRRCFGAQHSASQAHAVERDASQLWLARHLVAPLKLQAPQKRGSACRDGNPARSRLPPASVPRRSHDPRRTPRSCTCQDPLTFARSSRRSGDRYCW